MAKKTIERRALEWLKSGDVCEASQAMVFAALGMKGRSDYPLNCGDLKRCLLAAKLVGLDELHFHRVARLSWQWKAIVDNWRILRLLMNRDDLIGVLIRMEQLGVWE